MSRLGLNTSMIMSQVKIYSLCLVAVGGITVRLWVSTTHSDNHLNSWKNDKSILLPNLSKINCIVVHTTTFLSEPPLQDLDYINVHQVYT